MIEVTNAGQFIGLLLMIIGSLGLIALTIEDVQRKFGRKP